MNAEQKRRCHRNELPSAVENRSALCIAMLAVLGLVFCIGVIGGCAQKTKSAQEQASKQETVTPTTNAQEQAAQGMYLTLNVSQIPGGEEAALYRSDSISCEDGELAGKVTANGAGGASADVTKNKMGFLQINSIVITGTATPSIGSGTATGSGSATQTPSGTQTVTANQEPRANLSVPIAVGMPGSSQSQQATAASEGGAVGDPSQTNANPANYTSIKATPGQLQQAIDFLLALKRGQEQSALPPATQPATP